MTRVVQTKPGEPFIPAPVTKSYMEQRGAILDDSGASFWLKAAVLALEVRDPVDAFNDTEVLRKLAFLRMETSFRS